MHSFACHLYVKLHVFIFKIWTLPIQPLECWRTIWPRWWLFLYLNLCRLASKENLPTSKHAKVITFNPHPMSCISIHPYVIAFFLPTCFSCSLLCQEVNKSSCHFFGGHLGQLVAQNSKWPPNAMHLGGRFKQERSWVT